MVMVLALDARQEVGNFLETDCCPPSICLMDACSIMCNMISLLPDGPMWDRPKSDAMNRYRHDDCNGINCFDPNDVTCATLVDYAVYAGRILHNLIFNALWPALRESDPRTAYLTLDTWLDRLGWQDCYNASCRDPGLGVLGAAEIEGECGPVFCSANNASAELTLAVKRGIVLALIRLNMRPIKTLSNLNWIIEPLGARIVPRNVVIDPECDDNCAEFPQFSVCPVASKTIPRAPANGDCMLHPSQDQGFPGISDAAPYGTIHASYDAFCYGLGTVFPGVAAALCIIVSLLKQNGCCDPAPVIYNCEC